MRFIEVIIGWISDELAERYRRQGTRLHFEFFSRYAGLDAETMFRPPASPYVSVWAKNGMGSVLQEVASQRGRNLAPH